MLGMILFIVYFFLFHNKVLNKLGLSQRDDTLMLIGFLMNTVISSLFRVVDSLLVGQLDLMSLVFAALVFIMVYFNYKRL